MGTRRAGWTNVLLNTALAVLGIVVVLLLYALVQSILSSPADVTRGDSASGLVGDIIQVEVRNGCGVAGLAEGMTRFLRDQGFDVVEVGNYSSFDQAKTTVVDRVGNLETARKVAAALGLPEDRVTQEFQPLVVFRAGAPVGERLL